MLDFRGWGVAAYWGGGGLLERGWLFEDEVLHITKNDFQLTVKVYYEIIFFLDQLKTNLNFQFLCDQLGLCFFLLWAD